MKLIFAWLVSLIAMLGSLFFSDVMGFVPCTLCWYQRIAMYPLVLIFGIAVWKNRQDVLTYSFPLSIVGMLISIYHLGVQAEIIPEGASPCVQGVPCSAMYIQWFGFITIPFLSFIAFSLINLIQWKIYREKF